MNKILTTNGTYWDKGECGCNEVKLSSFKGVSPRFDPACKLSIGVYGDFTGIVGISPERAEEIWYNGLKLYEEKVHVKFHRTTKNKALITARMGPARRGVLAWMEVFDGCSLHNSLYNNDVVWNEFLFNTTAIHENGHGLGVSHSPNGVESIMAPVHNPNVKEEIDKWLFNELVPKYGSKIDVEPPTPTPDPKPEPEPIPTPTPTPIPNDGLIRNIINFIRNLFRK